jgi:copper resistance protein C
MLHEEPGLSAGRSDRTVALVFPILRAWAVTSIAIALTVSTAGAHAFLDRAEPRAGSTLKASPPRVRLWFTGALEPAYSRVHVVNAAGERVDAGDSQVDAANRAVLTVSLPALSPGTYKVVWRILSVDTHVSEGDFSFRVTP